MLHQKIRQCFSHSVHLVPPIISEFTYSDTGLTRNRKFPADKLTTFPVSQGSSSTKNGLLDLFGVGPQPPTALILNQQYVKFSLDALEAVFRHLSHFASFYGQRKLRCCFLIADDSAFTPFNKPVFAPGEYHVSEGHSIKGFYSMHLSVFYNLQRHTYSDALIQLIHQKNEFSAFCEMAGRHNLLTDTKDVFTGDRGYCSYNNMAHVKEEGRYFLFRTKDTRSERLVGNFGFPGADSLDIQVNATLVHSHKKKISIREDCYKRFVDAAASFDYVAYGSLNTYDLSSRIV